MRCAYPDSGVRLPQSYADQAGLPRTAFTYDAALAGLAYLAAGHLAHAREIAAGLLSVQADDGRLYRAYALDAGPVVHSGGTWAGDQAWAGIALCEVYREGGDPRLLAGARRLGMWVRDNHGPDSLSTADSAVLVALFDRLAGLTGDRAWLGCAQQAAGSVRRTWHRGGRYFTAATLAAQVFAWLAIGDHHTVGCLDWVLRNLRVTDTAGPRLTGITAEPGGDAVWLEGCAQYAVALSQTPGGAVPAQAQLCPPIRAQMMLGRDQTVAGRPLPAGCGVIAASSPLAVPGAPAVSQPVRHVGATAWLVLAGYGVNPLKRIH
jgi:hypothetical protein